MDLEKFTKELEMIEDINLKKVFITDYCDKLNAKENNELLEMLMNDEIEEKNSFKDLRLVRRCQSKREIIQLLSEISSNNRDLYHQAFENYDSLLQKTIELGRELKLTNSLALSNLYTFLLWKGYFSLYKEHKYSINDRKILIDGFFTEIIEGMGVCLNYSAMLNDLLIEANFSSTMIINKANKMERDYTPLERNIEKSKIFNYLRMNIIQLAFKNISNHACTLIKENNQFYIYDATNLAIFQLDSARIATMIAGKGNISLDPYMSYFFATTEAEKNLINDLCNQKSFSCPYSRKDFIFTWENNLELFQENMNLIEDFYIDIHTHLEQIANSTTDVSISKQIKELKNT